MNSEFFTNLVYIISSILFAFGLKFLGSPVTARRGNMLSALGMFLAVLATLCSGHIISLQWILIGMVLAGLISAFVPPHIFHHYLGPTLLGLFVTLGMAAVIEVCSQGTAPLAFEIYRQTGAFGNAFAFLMAGVVTNFTQIALVWKNVGRRTALWMLVISLPQVVLLGWMFNKL